MSKLINAALRGVAIGLLISVAISSLFTDVYSPVNPYSTMGIWYAQHLTGVGTMAVCILLWGLIGVLFQVGDWFFQQDWSLLRMTATHFISMFLGLLPLGILAGWFPLNLSNILFFSLIFAVIYAIIFWISLQKMKKTLKNII